MVGQVSLFVSKVIPKSEIRVWRPVKTNPQSGIPLDAVWKPNEAETSTVAVRLQDHFRAFGRGISISKSFVKIVVVHIFSQIPDENRVFLPELEFRGQIQLVGVEQVPWNVQLYPVIKS